MKTKIRAKYLAGSTHYFEIIAEITKDGVTSDIDGTLIVFSDANSGANDYEFNLADKQAIKLTKKEIDIIGDVAFINQER